MTEPMRALPRLHAQPLPKTLPFEQTVLHLRVERQVHGLYLAYNLAARVPGDRVFQRYHTVESHEGGHFDYETHDKARDSVALTLGYVLEAVASGLTWGAVPNI